MSVITEHILLSSSSKSDTLIPQNSEQRQNEFFLCLWPTQRPTCTHVRRLIIFFILSIFKMQSSSILSPLIFVTSILISSNIVTSVYMRKIFLGLYFSEYSARSAYGIFIAKT